MAGNVGIGLTGGFPRSYYEVCAPSLEIPFTVFDTYCRLARLAPCDELCALVLCAVHRA